MCDKCERENAGGGFVLIVVIWMAALLALIAAGFARSVQTYVRVTANSIESARAEALADSGVNLAIIDLVAMRTAPDRARRFPIEGTAVACAMAGDATISIGVQDAGGRINLNLAGEGLLAALFVGLGATHDAAARHADTIIDFRDRDDVRRPHGAEAAEYRAAGVTMRPKNAPFEAFEELHQVLGLEPEMIAAMRPHVTLHSASAGLDPSVIQPALLELLTGGQGQWPAAGQLRAAAGSLPAEFMISSNQRSFLVRSEVRLASGATYVREAVIELPAARSAAFTLRAWQRGSAIQSGAEGPAGPALPPC